MEVSLAARTPFQSLESYISLRRRSSSKNTKAGLECHRSARLMHILSYNTAFHFVGFGAAYYALSFLDLYVEITEGEVWNWQMLVAAVILLPGTIALVTSLSPMVTTLPAQPADRRWDTLFLCLVSRGTNKDTVLRSISKMCRLQVNGRIRLVLVTEEGRNFTSAQLGCDIVFVPNDYRAPRARYKARALEYFRKSQHLGNRDWVLHLDEETLVDEHCVGACVDFIERTHWKWGQGIITYNTVNYWDNPILTFAEVLRFRDDLGRFQCQHGRIHRTITTPSWISSTSDDDGSVACPKRESSASSCRWLGSYLSLNSPWRSCRGLGYSAFLTGSPCG